MNPSVISLLAVSIKPSTRVYTLTKTPQKAECEIVDDTLVSLESRACSVLCQFFDRFLTEAKCPVHFTSVSLLVHSWSRASSFAPTASVMVLGESVQAPLDCIVSN